MPSHVKRPVHLNLFKIRLPVAGVMSIMHRVSGLFMALAMPGVLYIFDLSLDGYKSFDIARELLHTLPLKIGLFLLLWALAHHFLAGIRYLLIDVDIGVEKPLYRYSAWAVILLAPVVALLLLGGLL